MYLFPHSDNWAKDYEDNVMKANPALVDELDQLKTHLHALYSTDKNKYQAEKKWFYDKIHELL